MYIRELPTLLSVGEDAPNLTHTRSPEELGCWVEGNLEDKGKKKWDEELGRVDYECVTAWIVKNKRNKNNY